MTLCACGKPLHYLDPKDEALVEETNRREGDTVIITTRRAKYRVQRHYYVLHNIKQDDLAMLFAQGIIELVK